VNTIHRDAKNLNTPWRILLVEDDDATRESATIKLKKEAFDVVTKVDGHLGLEYLKSDPHFDAILLDLRMPKSDGFEFMEKKGTDERIRDIPVIIFSNLNQREHVDRALRLGAKGYLVKAHHSIQEIVEELKNCLVNGICKVDN
jgi:CheY-like chemotaxis protein